MKTAKFVRPEYVINIVLYGGYTPGLENTMTPIGLDVLDGGDAVYGNGVGGVASGCRPLLVEWRFPGEGVSDYCQPAQYF